MTTEHKVPQDFYITLVNQLSGYALHVRAYNRGQVRLYAHNNLGKMWFTVYDQPPRETIIGYTINISDSHPLPLQLPTLET